MATIIKEGFAYKRTFLRCFYRRVYIILYYNGDFVLYSGRRVIKNISVKDCCFHQTETHFASNQAKNKFYFKISRNTTDVHLYFQKIQERRLWQEAFEVTSSLSNNKIDNFQVLHTVTSGTFGKVFICKTETDVASLKQINNKDSITLREGYLMIEFRHPFVMNAEEIFVDNNQFHIVMSFAIGGNLEKLLGRNGSFTEDEARFYMAEIVLAIGYLHRLNIAHRDVKPANILIMDNGHIRLTDFGLSAERMHADAVSSCCCGTVDYMAPEILRSKTYTRSVDWWATGVVLFQMISGRLVSSVCNKVPGTGKTFMAKALAGEIDGTKFFSISVANILSKYVGESESYIRNLFEVARIEKPSIIFFDEIDSLTINRSEMCHSYRGVLTELLVQMDGLKGSNEGILIMATTNKPHEMDSGILRRFDKLIYVPLPNDEDRRKLFESRFPMAESNFSVNNFDELVEVTKGHSGSDIDKMCNEANNKAVTRLLKCSHFHLANGIYTPCEPDSKCINIDIMEIPDRCVLAKPLATLEDVMECARHAKPRVNSSEVRIIEEFAKEKGVFIDSRNNEMPKSSFLDYFCFLNCFQ